VIIDVIELPDRSIVMAMMPPGSVGGPSTEIELWRLRTDRTGVASEPPRRLTSAATYASELSASANGERVTFLATRSQTDVYVADGDLRQGHIGTPRRFTLSDRDDSPYTWTPDSAAVIFDSTRNGTSDIFKQAVDSDIAEPLISGPEPQDYPGVSSDGRWLLYINRRFDDQKIMRMPLGGGAPAELLRGNGLRLQCAVHGRCVLLEVKDGSWVISSLDPFKGKGAELARAPLSYAGFRVLPDGDGFGYIVPPEDGGVRNRVRVISFSGGLPNDIVVMGATSLLGLAWLPSGSGFLAVDGGRTDRRLLLVSHTGASKVLWAPTTLSINGYNVPSPDEKHVAIGVSASYSNVWMVSGF
jgi:hypothetical protein